MARRVDSENCVLRNGPVPVPAVCVVAAKNGNQSRGSGRYGIGTAPNPPKKPVLRIRILVGSEFNRVRGYLPITDSGLKVVTFHSVAVPDPGRIRIQSGPWIRIQNPDPRQEK